jgi:hypothetical protein
MGQRHPPSNHEGIAQPVTLGADMQGVSPGDLANVRRPAAENGSYAHRMRRFPRPRQAKRPESVEQESFSVEHEADE